MKQAFAACALAFLLAACASYSGYNLRPGATEDDVLRTMGRAAMEFRNPDGSRELAYPRGPLGLETFMVDLGADGRMLEIRQVLTDGMFDTKIRPGITRDDVLRLIGPPGDEMDFPRMAQDSWEWRYRDTWGYIAFFSVNFDRSGIVVSKFKRRLERNESSK
jgi:hypothetical protein